MPYHRFKLDQAVIPSLPSVPAGRYTILRLLPLLYGQPRYLVKSMDDGHERAVMEVEIKLADRTADYLARTAA